MLHLIKKDIVIHHLSWALYIGMIIFFTIFNKDPIFIIALMSALIIMNVFYYDEEANGYKLWATLPFTRQEIVSARYISLLIISAIVMLFVMILNWQWDIIFWLEIIGSFITIVITAAICFPIFYFFAQKRVMISLLVMYIVFVIGAVHGIYYLYLALFDISFISPHLTAPIFYVLAGIVGLMIYLLSWKISLKIYNQKEIL